MGVPSCQMALGLLESCACFPWSWSLPKNGVERERERERERDRACTGDLFHSASFPPPFTFFLRAFTVLPSTCHPVSHLLLTLPHVRLLLHGSICLHSNLMLSAVASRADMIQYVTCFVYHYSCLMAHYITHLQNRNLKVPAVQKGVLQDNMLPTVSFGSIANISKIRHAFSVSISQRFSRWLAGLRIPDREIFFEVFGNDANLRNPGALSPCKF